jgi:hypothetical protein
VHRLLVTANVVPSSPILVTLMMEVIRSSKTVVLTRATWHHIPEGSILQLRGSPIYHSYWGVAVCQWAASLRGLYFQLFCCPWSLFSVLSWCSVHSYHLYIPWPYTMFASLSNRCVAAINECQEQQRIQYLKDCIWKMLYPKLNYTFLLKLGFNFL